MSNNSKNKKERRQKRYIRNVINEMVYKKEAWDNGKLIEPNHNNGPYPKDYTVEIGIRLVDIIKESRESSKTNEEFVQRFRLYKNKIRDYILHYNPELKKDNNYDLLKKLLETYWDEPDNLITVYDK